MFEIVVALGLALVPAPSGGMEGLIQKVRRLLVEVEVNDRPVAYRNYAKILVSAGQCDDAVQVFVDNPDFDAELTETMLWHSVGLNDLSCAAEFGKLMALRANASDGLSPTRRAILQMFAGAAMTVGGNPEAGNELLSSAEAFLARNPAALPDGKARQNIRTLWDSRNRVLTIFHGTDLYHQYLFAHVEELKNDPKVAWESAVMAYMHRLSAADRPDMVQELATKMSPWIEKKQVNSILLSKRQDAVDIYGKNGIPHCPGIVTDDKVLTSREMDRKAENLPVSSGPDPLDQIITSTQRAKRIAVEARCPDPFS